MASAPSGSSPAAVALTGGGLYVVQSVIGGITWTGLPAVVGGRRWLFLVLVASKPWLAYRSDTWPHQPPREMLKEPLPTESRAFTAPSASPPGHGPIHNLRSSSGGHSRPNHLSAAGLPLLVDVERWEALQANDPDTAEALAASGLLWGHGPPSRAQNPLSFNAG